MQAALVLSIRGTDRRLDLTDGTSLTVGRSRECEICLEDHAVFGAIGLYYSDFRQISDEEVIEILRCLPARQPDQVAAQ